MKTRFQIPGILNTQIVFAILVWAVLVIRFGYRFGTGDHVEMLTYALYISDHSLYPNDFFIQGLQEKTINERTVVSCLLLPFINHLEVACFLFQFFFTVLLVVGLQKLGKQIIGNIGVARLGIIISCVLLFDRGLGNVELYNDGFQASSASAAVIAFGLYYFFKNKILKATLLMSIASILHPVEGLTVFFVLAACLFWFAFYKKEIPVSLFFKSMALYVLTAGIFIALLLQGKADGVNAFSAGFDQDMFFKIYHEFRHSHHFIFSSFPLYEKIAFAFFLAINLVFGLSSNKKIFWFNVFALMGTAFYIICTDYLHIVDIANLQFYKVSQWVKFIASLVVAKYIYELLQVRAQWFLDGLKFNAVLVCVALVALVVLFEKPGFIEGNGIWHQYGSGWKNENDRVAVSMWVFNCIDKNAVFVQPFDFSELKYFGRASSYVDWKAFLKNRKSIFEWYKRVQLVYGISLQNQERGFDLNQRADDYYNNMGAAVASSLKFKGVTHLISSNKKWQHGTLLFENETYAVYKL